MRILIAGEETPGSLGRFFQRGLQQLGHEVQISDIHGEVTARIKFPRVPLVADMEREWHARRYNRGFIQHVEQFKPHIVLVLKGIEVYARTLAALRERGNVVLINYNPDSPLNPINTSKHLLEAIPHYDLHLTWGEFLLPHLRRLGARRAAYLPFGFDPSVYRPLKLSSSEYQELHSDVCFVGTWDLEREALLEQLVGKTKLRIWGPNWEKLPTHSPLRPLAREERWSDAAVKAIMASKIALNFIREQNGDAHNMRTFEIPATGRFMLTTRTREQEAFLGEGQGMECFANGNELVDKIKYYLAHDEEREAIARRGHEIVIERKHTYFDRMSTLVNMISDMGLIRWAKKG